MKWKFGIFLLIKLAIIGVKIEWATLKYISLGKTFNSNS